MNKVLTNIQYVSAILTIVYFNGTSHCWLNYSFSRRAVCGTSVGDSISPSLGHGDAPGMYLVISVPNIEWIIWYPEGKILVVSLNPLPVSSYTIPTLGHERVFQNPSQFTANKSLHHATFYSPSYWVSPNTEHYQA
jgi:hypothetical protein